MDRIVIKVGLFTILTWCHPSATSELHGTKIHPHRHPSPHRFTPSSPVSSDSSKSPPIPHRFTSIPTHPLRDSSPSLTDSFIPIPSQIHPHPHPSPQIHPNPHPSPHRSTPSTPIPSQIHPHPHQSPHRFTPSPPIPSQIHPIHSILSQIHPIPTNPLTDSPHPHHPLTDSPHPHPSPHRFTPSTHPCKKFFPSLTVHMSMHS